MSKNFKILRDKVVSTDEGAEAVANARREAVAEHIEYTLAELRKARELTQTELATILQSPQSGISRVENSEDALVSTLARFVEALGGHLELTAVFDGERMPLRLATAG